MNITLRIYDPRIIAIDLRFRRSGFAMFEGPRRLLDYGTIAIHRGEQEVGACRLSDLLKMALPSTILLKKESWQGLRARSDAQQFISAVTGLAKARSIRIRLLEQSALDATFRRLGCETKAEISASLALIFPELVWKVPPQRRAWQSEHPRQTVFDSIALGLAFWQNETSLIEDPRTRQTSEGDP